ncbi:MAG: DUF3078 domain-containing protein [Saprospiraceae bacterium]|nr:DUF3078 domain-containing protein [Saprospiraceae bacterium]
MNFKSLLAFFILLTSLNLNLSAQAGDDRLNEVKKMAAKEVTDGWKFGGGFGFDLSGLGILNPQLGSGGNRFAFGGLTSLFGNNKQAKYYWNNDISLQLAAQRIGGKAKPFQKNLDILRLGSRFGYDILKSKLFAALDITAESQLLPTYVGNNIEGDEADLLSQFLSPVRIAVAPGIDYKPNAQLSFFFAPASWRFIYVGNDSLAALTGQPLGNELGKNTRSQLGYALKAQYVTKFLKDKVALTSKIGWFADYTKSLNGNVLWQNNMSIALFKGVSLDLFGDIFYDHFTLVAVKDIPEGTAAADVAPFLGLKPSYTGGFLLKYNLIF